MKLLALLVLLAAAVPSASAQVTNTLSGWLSTTWGDPGPGAGEATQVRHFLFVEGEGVVELRIDPAAIEAAGGLLRLDQSYVTVEVGDAAGPAPEGALTAQGQDGGALEVLAVQAAPPPQGAAPTGAAAVSGSRPYINILCRFPDVADQPVSPSYVSGLFGGTYPGLDHYWREVSYNQVNVAGSAVVGWYTLPNPRSYYVSSSGLSLTALFTDCTGVANNAVNFGAYQGINLMFNAELDGFAHGGRIYATLDGVTRSWPITFLPPWGYLNQGVLAHEMGHSFGFPHSNNADGDANPYENPWDVMSDHWTLCYTRGFRDANYGCLGQHTISFHKDLAGWIPADRRLVVGDGEQRSATLERLAGPSTADAWMILIPINGSYSDFYTAEVRKYAGYDGKLLGEAVVIHRVNETRREPAWVIGDGMWTAGETFLDTTNNISIAVEAATATGFRVTVANDPLLADVPVAGKEWMAPWIELFYDTGITTGCATNPPQYCPEREVTRAEMAVFVLRALNYPNLPYTPPGQSGTFDDVPVAGKEWMEAWIEQFYDLAITTGCATKPLQYCPEREVTRAEMAVFILRAKYGSGYQPPRASGTFADVPVAGKEWMEPWIEQFYAEGVTTGCGADPLAYCPEREVTRAEMAVFILRAFDQLPKP